MSKIDEMISCTNLLYKVAFEKTNNTQEAEDLVQDTFLSTLKTINKGVEIQNIQSFLLRVLNNKFYDLIRTKKKMPQITINEYNVVFIDENNSTDDKEELRKTELQESIRRELAFLSKIYREVMVQFYVDGKSMVEIASNLNIPLGTVQSRLDYARKRVKKGVGIMESYTKNSYKPELLTILVSGRYGINNEPFSVINDKIEQNILILAYDKPLTILELSKEIGIPTAYIEEKVDKLVKNELIRVTGTKVYTDFLIIRYDLCHEKKVVQKKFVDETFDEMSVIFRELIKHYISLGILNNFNQTQLYIYAYMIVLSSVVGRLADDMKLINHDDYPDRPNAGKWLINCGFARTINDEELYKPRILYIRDAFINNNKKLTFEIWETYLGNSPLQDNNHYAIPEYSKLLYAIEKDQNIEHLNVYLIPELINYGYLTKKKKLINNIPIITSDDKEKLLQLNNEYIDKYYLKAKDRLIEMMLKNKLTYPAHLKINSPMVYTLCMYGISDQYLLKTAEKGIIKIDKTKNYPVGLITEHVSTTP